MKDFDLSLAPFASEFVHQHFSFEVPIFSLYEDRPVLDLSQ